MKNKKNFFIICILTTLSLSLILGSVYANSSKTKFFDRSKIDNTVTQKSNISNKTFILNGKEETLTYTKTKREKDIYVDTNGAEYDFDGDKLVSFWEAPDINQEKIVKEKIGEKEAEKIANDFCKNNVQDFSRYTLSNTDYNETTKQYTVVYIHKIQGYNTIDRITVFVDNSNKIKCFVAYFQNALDKYENVNINKDIIINAIIEQIKDKYENKLISYNIIDLNLSIIDNKCVMLATVGIEHEGEYKDENGKVLVITTGETIIYELE